MVVDEVPYSLRNPKVDEGWSFPGPEQALAPLSVHPLLGRALHANPDPHSHQHLVPHPCVSS